MESGKKFRLNIKKSYYFQDGVAHDTKVEYLDFYPNGDLHMDGDDNIGTFTMKGELSNGFLYLTKEYHGKHKVYYVGRLSGHIVQLAYDFAEKWDSIKSKIESNNVMAEIEFETTTYKLHLTDSNVILDLFLDSEKEKVGKFKGIAFKDGQFAAVKAKVTCKVKLAAKGYEEKFIGKYDPYTLTYVIHPKKGHK